MGEVKELVGTKKPRTRRTKKVTSEGLIGTLEFVIEDIDKALTIKNHDLQSEGQAAHAENSYKLGILRAADSLIRRAKCLLEDYGTDLAFDTDPSTDELAAGGDEIEKASREASEEMDTEEDE